MELWNYSCSIVPSGGGGGGGFKFYGVLLLRCSFFVVRRGGGGGGSLVSECNGGSFVIQEWCTVVWMLFMMVLVLCMLMLSRCG